MSDKDKPMTNDQVFAGLLLEHQNAINTLTETLEIVIRGMIEGNLKDEARIAALEAVVFEAAPSLKKVLQ